MSDLETVILIFNLADNIDLLKIELSYKSKAPIKFSYFQ